MYIGSAYKGSIYRGFIQHFILKTLYNTLYTILFKHIKISRGVVKGFSNLLIRHL
jgi:hypothetical protein